MSLRCMQKLEPDRAAPREVREEARARPAASPVGTEASID
eukprot:CAMPEP_0197534280 /NCGR_PEP_ID=MMETSP1318-20131121/46553_1 /TAXON_ID=552666 /ORGANISM="Partenskyella glossopodia, Strain RCC365" /LENGTH=39 /DNA_ID= /DNA_START= /DNA_END= /DNA_ORIENTATION=